MQACQRAGIDLPLKALVWEDGDGTAWLTYNDPAWLARRHALGPSIEPVISAMSAMLAALTRHATGAGPGELHCPAASAAANKGLAAHLKCPV